MVKTNDNRDDINDQDGITNEDKGKVFENTAPSAEQINDVTDEEFENAQKFFKTGKKNLILGQYDDAVSNIADACKVYALKYGELSSECADVYFYYGKALLELARSDTTVFGNGLNDQEDSDNEETDKKGIIDEEKVTPGTSAGTGGTEVEEEDDEEDDEISNLEQAWEMFELAKLIYKSHYKEKNDDEKYFKLKRICESLLKLGEISIEQEQFDQAINDINESIKIQENEICGSDINKRDERLLAESYYQLSLIYQLKNSFSMAKELHSKSINILQLCVEKLKSKLASFDNSKTTTNADVTDKTNDIEKKELVEEIDELELLIPEMCTKLDELNEQELIEQQPLNHAKEIAKDCFISSSSTSKSCTATTSTSTQQVKDITSLVKSKRKLEPSTETANKTVKKEGNKN